MGNCLSCIHFQDCKGKDEHQQELADGEVSCLDGVHQLTAKEMPSIFPKNLPPKLPKYLHLYSNEIESKK